MEEDDRIYDNAGRFINGAWRFRETNTTDSRLPDSRLPDSLSKVRMMTDSFPVRVPHLGKQHIRQKYYCHYHRMRCVKYLS